METMREHVVDYTAGAYRAAASVGWYTRIFLSSGMSMHGKEFPHGPLARAGLDPLRKPASRFAIYVILGIRVYQRGILTLVIGAYTVRSNE